jgi:hypothetical protein
MSLARLVPLLPCIALIGCGAATHAATAPVHHAAPASAAPAAIRIPGGSGHLAAMAPKDGLILRAKPGGRVIAHLRPKTDWGSPTVVWARERRGNWLGVVATALPNNKVGWLDIRHDHPRMWRSTLTLEADLSKRTLELRRGSKVVLRIPVTIGGPSSPTPVGRFTVTDKLIPTQGVAYYGCCLLALSGHQPNLRPGWAGGDRIAIHGSPTGQVGAAASGGCLRALDKDLKRLMKVVPVGTPVVIRA